ncbi:class F sortase [Streptomyces sp. BHT-5-2]|uniref:class F sortase n=1 Tax=Streptomyces sp. BHT-5-2 TaxID=2866715 RepID=UPI001C8E75F6|nr:class F sortase [Streptomyces sp. BHT-5-2]QZL06053.1 class F sortase [Streptomyces sp. BHT-5-2]
MPPDVPPDASAGPAPPPPPPKGGRRGWRHGRARAAGAAAAAVTVLASGAGAWLIVSGARETAPPPQPPAAQGFTGGPPGKAPATGRAVPPLPPAEPLRVAVPSLHIDAPLTRLGLAADGSLAPPPVGDRDLAGWYAEGTPPGATGTALIAGHVDTRAGPAVFYRLGALKKGHTVRILRADGRTAVFTVDAVEVYDGRHFPDEKVYGEARRPELRLITCGGGFSRARQEYLGNVVVFAHLTGSQEAGTEAAPLPWARPHKPIRPPRQPP